MATQIALADIVNSASDVLRGVQQKTVKATDVQTRAVSLVKEMAGQVNGPGDALWDLHCAIARDVLERGGLSSAELREWVSVQQRREDASPGT